ncbi:MAG: hypothetical protein F6K17_39485 [Okeania sp. SIO3C4]|nr:hypothetical protein [Okeania sp. SIO3C4]
MGKKNSHQNNGDRFTPDFVKIENKNDLLLIDISKKECRDIARKFPRRISEKVDIIYGDL